MTMLTLAVAQSLPESDLQKSVAAHARLARVAARAGATFVLFPEMSLTGYGRHFIVADALDPTDLRLTPLQDLADLHQLVVVAGAPVASSAGLHIGALIFRPGAPCGIHLKQYLHDGEEVAFVSGGPPEPLEAHGFQIALSICADITHPEHAAAAARRGCHIYAAGCFITPTGYALDQGLLRGYASTHRMVVLMANFGGPIPPWPSAGRSAVWSPNGELLAAAPESGEVIVVSRLTMSGWQAEVRSA